MLQDEQTLTSFASSYAEIIYTILIACHMQRAPLPGRETAFYKINELKTIFLV